MGVVASPSAPPGLPSPPSSSASLMLLGLGVDSAFVDLDAALAFWFCTGADGHQENLIIMNTIRSCWCRPTSNKDKENTCKNEQEIRGDGKKKDRHSGREKNRMQ